ncbi:BMP family ABC transporter substrate-binding protein [uncultured Parabacteroides sp.]|uniref:BMP family ABC transporter substrate-binding protein n=2 Tax=uncultured Parabacteroides sp. TaxID=512312 RepID=UPI00261A208C|nr:BMP family ABC transporter substrate-binding protein [uncultured Parabacteroides sp.]
MKHYGNVIMYLISMYNPFRIFLAMTTFLVTGALSSCNHADELEPVSPIPQIVFLFSPSGLGDMSYNDCILEGVQRFKMEHKEIDIYIYSPESLPEAEKIFSDWLKRPESDIPVLFVLGSSDYEPMVEKHLIQHDLTPNKSLLLFESQKQYDDKQIHTFQISMFGASYLAGAVARQCTGDRKPLVLLANLSDSPINIAKDGFVAGYGSDCDVEYLADDWTGYVSASLAYRKMSDWAVDYDFIFPVAGGSNAGIYRYSREFEDSPYLAGMDIDQSSLSNWITGSVIKHIDQLIYRYLTEWVTTGIMPENQLYGLESGYSDWLVAPRYANDFNSLVNDMRQQAVIFEKEYYETNSY